MNNTPVKITKPMTPAERNLRMQIEQSKATEIRLLKEMSRPKILIEKVPEGVKPTSYYLEMAKQKYQNIQASKSTRSVSVKSSKISGNSSKSKLLSAVKCDSKSQEQTKLDDSIPEWLHSRADFQETVKAYKIEQEQRILQILGINYHGRSGDDKKLIVNYLMTIQFFSALPLEVLIETSNRLIKQEYQTGQKIIRKGDLSDGMIIIYRGVANVVIDGILIAVKHPGDVVGDTSLDFRMPRSADVIANTDCIIFKLLSEDYEAAVLNTKRQEKLKNSEFLKSMMLFQNWSSLKLMRLSALLNVKIFKEKSTIFKRNDPSLSIFFIKEGKVDVFAYVSMTQANKWPVSANEWDYKRVNREYLTKIAEISEGQYFGEQEVIKGTSRVLKAVTTKKCIILELNKEHVFEHFNENELESLSMLSFTKVPELKKLQEKILNEIDSRASRENALLDALKVNLNSNDGRLFVADGKVKKLNGWITGYKARKAFSAKNLKNKVVFENISVLKIEKNKRRIL
jgi:CRP-like cAMP-binding protein